jgi:hypothetical protein
MALPVAVRPRAWSWVLVAAAHSAAGRHRRATSPATSIDPLVAELFDIHSMELVRLARLFVDDRNAAEDLVQETFIRLARNAHRIHDRAKAPAPGTRGAGARVISVVGALSVVGLVLSYDDGRFVMDWWIFEVLVTAGLIALTLWLGPFIKRFGRSYAADVFRSNPGTGKSFIVLTDFAYYLIFGAYVLLTTRVERPSNWTETLGAAQVQAEVARTAGLMLLIGLLHGVNLLILPIIGRLLTLNRRLDQQLREAERGE